MADSVVLQRPPVGDIVFDAKAGKNSQGWPVEHVSAGSLASLVAYACFYHTRQLRPELVGFPAKRLGLDEDFCRVFWTMMPTFSSPRQIIGCMLSMLADSRRSGGVGGGDALLPVQICDCLTFAVDPTNRFLLWLSARHQAELISGAGDVISSIRAAALEDSPTREGGWEHGSAASPAVPRMRSVSDGAFRDETLLTPLQAESVSALEEKLEVAKLAMDIASGGGRSAPVPVTITLEHLADAIREYGGGDGVSVGDEGSSTSSALGVDGAKSVKSVSSSLSAATATYDPRLTYGELWDAPYEMIAAQWTHIEHNLYRSIPMAEWLACGWDKPRYEHAADCIRRYIDHFNAVTLWVTAEVLALDTARERAAMIVRFIKVAVLLRRYNNFSALVELCMGLRRDVIARLSETWALVPTVAKERLAAINAIADDKKNYRAYKEALKAVPPSAPIVPHLGAHSAELTMQDTLLPADKSVNGVSLLHFRRARELYKLTLPLVNMQENGYSGSGLPTLSPSLVNQMNTIVRPFYFAFDEDREAALVNLERRSHAIEPPIESPGSGGEGERGEPEEGEEEGGGRDKSPGWMRRAARSFFPVDRDRPTY